MADEKLTSTSDDESVDSLGGAASESREGTTNHDLDEHTLGRSESVFDAGVDLLAPVAAPAVPPAQPVGGAPVDQGVTIIPMSQRERRRRVRLEARRVRRIVRHIEPWSVLKVSIIFYACLWLIFLLAGVLLWSFAESSGTLESVEDLIESLFTLEESNDFFSGSTIFRSYAVGTLALAIAGIAFNVLLSVLYNLISDLTGGVRITVIEEESARFQPPRRRAR